MIDDILVDYLETTLHVFSIGVIFLAFFQVILNFFRQHLLLYLSQKIDVSLILNYYRHVLNLPMNFFDTRKVGAILSGLSDATKIRQAVSGATITVISHYYVSKLDLQDLTELKIGVSADGEF
ncbi:ABC transporter transmembrane domain-containing protein [Natroniella sp. ANB-PHB2]|uniref:ABC transporter transmembrane domain-containing protein n=1 Tax=Natroniella sp. ANB-PHB2 TaxID=3384444 RepID=UPI0038D44C70